MNPKQNPGSNERIDQADILLMLHMSTRHVLFKLVTSTLYRISMFSARPSYADKNGNVRSRSKSVKNSPVKGTVVTLRITFSP